MAYALTSRPCIITHSGIFPNLASKIAPSLWCLRLSAICNSLLTGRLDLSTSDWIDSTQCWMDVQDKSIMLSLWIFNRITSALTMLASMVVRRYYTIVTIVQYFVNKLSEQTCSFYHRCRQLTEVTQYIFINRTHTSETLAVQTCVKYKSNLAI